MLVPYATVFVFLYGTIVPAEEELLRAQFAAEYARYRGNVPRLVPRLTPWPAAHRAPFDWTALWYEARLGLLLAAIYGVMRGAAWLRAS